MSSISRQIEVCPGTPRRLRVQGRKLCLCGPGGGPIGTACCIPGMPGWTSATALKRLTLVSHAGTWTTSISGIGGYSGSWSASPGASSSTTAAVCNLTIGPPNVPTTLLSPQPPPPAGFIIARADSSANVVLGAGTPLGNPFFDVTFGTFPLPRPYVMVSLGTELVPSVGGSRGHSAVVAWSYLDARVAAGFTASSITGFGPTVLENSASIGAIAATAGGHPTEAILSFVSSLTNGFSSSRLTGGVRFRIEPIGDCPGPGDSPNPENTRLIEAHNGKGYRAGCCG